jgi:hypothetical protein
MTRVRVIHPAPRGALQALKPKISKNSRLFKIKNAAQIQI